jgi:hypothetical protein
MQVADYNKRSIAILVWKIQHGAAVAFVSIWANRGWD